MNKKIILSIILIISCGLMKAETNNEPTRIKRFYYEAITFNGSKKTIDDLIRFNDPDADKVALLHGLASGSFEDLGTIGSPKCYSQSDPTAKIVVLLREKSGYLCDDEKLIVVTDRENFRDICTRAAQYRDMKKDTRETTEEDVLKVSP